MTQYLELEIPCAQDLGEILMAELSQLDYDSFLQEEDHIKAYIEQSLFQHENLRQVLDYYGIDYKTIRQSLMEDKNWNEAWEKNYPPIIIGDTCYVRAAFHDPKPQYPHEIVIQPKMAFGTGHHATTSQMIELMLKTDFRQKNVLDMGCGSGILSIMAARLGAEKVTAVDNDEWAYQNTLENFYINKIQKADVILGDIDDVSADKYDIILSNITKNINLQYIGHYANMLENEGKLVVSGFFEADLEDISQHAIKHGFRLLSSKTHNNWTAAIYIYEKI